MCTDLRDSIGHNFLNLCGYSMSKLAAERCMKEAGMNVKDVDIVEVHDCFAPNEVRVLFSVNESLSPNS